MQELTDEIVVTNKLGIHARPAATIVEKMLKFDCEVFISFNGNRVNAKSIMGLLTLAATQGARLSVWCKGDDAPDAMSAMKELFASGFGDC